MKYNIILDIDETLVFNYSNNELGTSIHIPEGTYSIKVFKGGSESFLCVKRPYLNTFLEYIFQHFNVGIWTAGNIDYAVECVNTILTKEQYNNLSLFIARSDNYEYYDILKKEYFEISCESVKLLKDLEYLFKHPVYKKQFQKRNTVLIDDSEHYMGTNQGRNIILIDKFNIHKTNDTSLLKILSYFKRLKRNKQAIDKLKLPFYKTIKHTRYTKRKKKS